MSGRLAGKVAFVTEAACWQARSNAVRLAQMDVDITAVDIGNVVLFLTSDEVRHISGVALPVDAVNRLKKGICHDRRGRHDNHVRRRGLLRPL